MNWIFILLAVGVLLVFAVVRLINQHAAQEQLRSSQTLVNDAMRTILPSLKAKLKLSDAGIVRSSLVADVWGRGILAFEFIMPVDQQVEQDVIYYELSTILKSYATGHDVAKLDDNLPAFVVSDIWYDETGDNLHVDIAHVLNDATYAYLADLKKVNESQY
ncbi:MULTISPECIES: hypothetical protein [Weissella]|uniref:hypothetical protein n=1 Tax=Weissella TaxID=46255 RepID=UPI001185DB30|nr:MULTISPECIES: hypothetical protein [Weissella]QVV91794.1 hypothetical protein KHQ32_02655 [Weissella tructae]